MFFMKVIRSGGWSNGLLTY